ncbi:MAG: response regulator [bacterium]|nr:response regulator [bacterium]
MKKIRILFVDDDDSTKDIIQHGKKNPAYEIHKVDIFEDAATKIKEEEFHLLFFDIMMFTDKATEYEEDYAGWEFISANLELLGEYIQKKRLFILSGATDHEERARELELEDQFIAKPIGYYDFWEKVKSVLEEQA